MIGLCFPSSQETPPTSNITKDRSRDSDRTSRRVPWHDVQLANWVFEVKNHTTRPATQVGRRPAKGGLGGHEAGVSGVDEGAENASLPLRKRGRTTISVCATFSDFCGANHENCSEKRNRKNDTSLHYSWSRRQLEFCFLVARYHSNELWIIWITHLIFSVVQLGWSKKR